MSLLENPASRHDELCAEALQDAIKKLDRQVFGREFGVYGIGATANPWIASFSWDDLPLYVVYPKDLYRRLSCLDRGSSFLKKLMDKTTLRQRILYVAVHEVRHRVQRCDTVSLWGQDHRAEGILGNLLECAYQFALDCRSQEWFQELTPEQQRESFRQEFDAEVVALYALYQLVMGVPKEELVAFLFMSA